MQEQQPQYASEPVTIERIAPGGSGVSHLASGEVVFVAGAAPGDVVELRDVTRRKGTLHATTQRMLRSGPARVEPPCVYARQCGGCDFMQLSQAGQRQAKLDILGEALDRVGGHPHGDVAIDFVASEREFAYRSRMRLHVDLSGNVGLLSARSHQVVPIDQCLVATPLINAAIERLHGASDSSRRLLALCAEIELRESPLAPHLSARLYARPKIKLDARKFAPMFAPDTLIATAGLAEADRAVQRFSVHPTVDVLAPLSAFTQVNDSVNQKLVALVLAAAARHSVSSFMDAYAGAGNFTLPLLACGLVGESIDTCAAGIYCARAVARDHGWPYDGFQVGDALILIASLVRAKRTFDMVLLDPPRQGAKGVLAVALRLKPRLIVLVACDPVALARDLEWLAARGASVESLTLFDMFPQTHHFETVAVVRMPRDD